MPKERRENTNSIIRDALVAKGYRPTDPDDIDAMLDAIGGEEFPADKVERMLRKTRGEEPIGVDSADDAEVCIESLQAEEKELVAFYRAKGKEIPPAIQAKLAAMRQRAKQQGEVNNGE